ncbi:MAG: erythromycin esterase family protein [Roseobacter sp.]|jgi:erythromycin esterase-like protein/predicted phosphoribosyltransferase/dienelactone hydrolase
MGDSFVQFSDRADAGRQLGDSLAALQLENPLIYALPRGGVPVAVEVARRLVAPLDLILVRKIGAPGNPEVALGAIVEGAQTHMIINEDVRRMSGADDAYLEAARSKELDELERRRKRYIGDRRRLDPAGRTAIVIDDGLATGATMKAALSALRRGGAERIVVALPVAPIRALDEISGLADDVICLHPAKDFFGVGGFYRDFHQLSDSETVALLDEAARVSAPDEGQERPKGIDRRQVTIPPLGLVGDLSMPRDPVGLVVFAHGSGSSRLSPRNVYVAQELNEQGFATLLFDLLTLDEAKDRGNVFDIPLLAERVVEACMWAGSEPDTADLPLGLFGASTGAAAALVAAAEVGDRVAAVVSRGGRPDLAGSALPRVAAPSLLVVGSLDHDVLRLNEKALALMTCTKGLQIVPGATHLFEEPGTLDMVISHAADWFDAHLVSPETVIATPETPARSPDIAVLRAGAEALPPISDPAFADAFDRFGAHRVVLLGEATHGTSEFYRARAAITRRLIERHGFSIVAVEADWPDASSIDRHIRRIPQPAMRRQPFARFPTWMWRNAEFQTFVDELRQHNDAAERDARARFYGLDLYNMTASIEAVLSYLDRVDRGAAEIARARYACLLPWSSDPAAYGRAALTHGFATCENAVTEILLDLLDKEIGYAQRDARQNGDLFFDAMQNARLVTNAERYYRAMYYGSRLSWNLRDRHMFDTLESILEHAGPHSKAVVWAHNSHIGDARFTDMGRQRGELNIGQLCRQAFGDEAALVGFGTASGTVAAASEWDAPMETKVIRSPRPDSFEHLCHQLDEERFLFDLRPGQNPDLRDVLMRDRLERYIGVIYRPETERASHYGAASLAAQYDCFVWFDKTTAVRPLPALANEKEDETYPFGL